MNTDTARGITAEVAEVALKEFSSALDTVDTVRRPGVSTRFQPGVSGNPAGPPPAPDDATLTEWLIHVLGKKGAKELAVELIAIAKSPGVSPTKLSAIQYIYDRIEGKPRQATTVSTNEEHPLVTIFRKITDDSKALEGHIVPALSAHSVYEALDGEGDSEDPGVTVS